MIQPFIREDNTSADVSDLSAKLKSIIQSRRIVRLSELTQAVGVDGDTVREHTQDSIHRGEIEYLTPAWLDWEQSGELGDRAMELVYYRWVQQTDRDYVWQKHINRPAQQNTSSFVHHPPFEHVGRPLRRAHKDPANTFQMLRSLLLLYLH